MEIKEQIQRGLFCFTIKVYINNIVDRYPPKVKGQIQRRELFYVKSLQQEHVTFHYKSS